MPLMPRLHACQFQHSRIFLLQAPGSSRDLLLLDLALESWLRMLVERQDKRALSGDDLVELMSLVLGNAALAGTSAELELVAAQWEAVRNCPDRCGCAAPPPHTHTHGGGHSPQGSHVFNRVLV